MENIFLVKRNCSPQYTKLQIFKGFLESFECKISDAYSNKFVAMVYVFYRQKNKAHWTMEVANLWEKISWWTKFLKKISKKKARQAPWMEEDVQNLLAQWKLWCVMDSKHKKCAPIVEWKQ
jgi:hypothetical protein